MDREYLSAYDSTKIDSSIRRQKPFDSVRTDSREYPVAETDSEDEHTFLTYSMVVSDDNLDPEEYIAFDVLDYALCSTPGAPVKKALIDAGIGKDVYSDYSNSICQPYFSFIAKDTDRDRQDELKDSELESLTEMGECVVQPILQELPKANEAGEEALMEVLSHFPGNEQSFGLAMKLFRERKERRALFAGYLAKLGDDRALPELIAAAGEEKLPYLTFIEIRNAIEILGGVCPERSYEDDPEYEALRDMDLT